MKAISTVKRKLRLSRTWQSVFNLNDSRWGRGEDANTAGEAKGEQPSTPQDDEPARTPQPQDRNKGGAPGGKGRRVSALV